MDFDKNSAIFRTNQRKIYKWIYLLLKKHNYRLGLKIICWSGPPGINNPYFSFFFYPIRDNNGHPIYNFKLIEEDYFAPVLYQDHIGLPGWAVGSQLTYPNQDTLEIRTNKVFPWIEEELNIIKLSQELKILKKLESGKPEFWEQTCEKYLLSWKLLGHYMAIKSEFMPLETPGESDYYGIEPDFLVTAESFLPETKREDILYFGDGIFWLHTGRICKNKGVCLDWYLMHKEGIVFSNIFKSVRQFIGS